MNIRFIPLNVVLLLGFSCILLGFSAFSNAAQHGEAQRLIYKASADPMQDVEYTLERAKNNDKLALIILGAQWCHDSTGLAKKFNTPEMRTILENNYETVFVDVGYYDDRRDITNRFGQAHYFSTPTVMVVEPQSETLLNADTLQKWGIADSVPLGDYIEYFSGFNDGQSDPIQPISADNLHQINQFEQTQSNRLMHAYQILGPELRADVEREAEQVPDEMFIQRWREIRSFRLQLQADIQALYARARTQQEIQLDIPKYEKFSWE